MRRLFAALTLLIAAAPAQEPLKQSSALYPPDVMARVRANVADGQWAAGVRARVVEAAAPWRGMDDETLWGLMVGATLPRSWMVWSDGHSPVTGEPVPMYNWKMDAVNHPWKVQDPTSGAWFPTNDFKAYYDSGLDERGVFDEARADRSLLFNAAHPDPNDPLHLFGVDDGHGYVNEKGERWLFVATYLIYGQWKQAVLGGINQLSAAWAVTGDPVYARKAGILLDRVADLYPTFDFKTQGILYEGPGSAGYLSTWHDSCEETRELALAYDLVFPALREDPALVEFLSRQATRYGLENPKASFADIQRNIEERILRDALAHPEKIHSNYPRAEICQAVITKVLQRPEDSLWAILDPMLEKATAVDGVTGEKGLANYSAFTIQALAQFLAEFSKADPEFLPAVLARQPRLHDTYRFHIDTMCLDRYYPLSGDSGNYAFPLDRYVGMNFNPPGAGSWPLAPSTYRLLWDLYQATGDVAFAQTLYRENGQTVEGLPHDIFGGDAGALREELAALIAQHGAEVELGSVNKEEWRIAILRSGRGEQRRALWLDYDSGGGHSHQDGMNLGLFAQGLDLLPEMGYPPVQYGGWGSPKGRRYAMTAAHNTVVVDGKSQANAVGETTLWIDMPPVQAIRASAPGMYGGDAYDRTAALIDVDDARFYVLDVFRVAGGTRHTKFVQSHFGSLAVDGLRLAEAPDFGHDTQTRNFAMDAAAGPGWRARWAFEDVYGLLPAGRSPGMHYTDLTNDAAAGTSEAWISTGGYDATEERWIPRLAIERTAGEGAPLISTFVSVYQPHAGDSPALPAARLPVADAPDGEPRDSDVALWVEHPGGGYDIVLLPDRPGEKRFVRIPEGAVIESDGALAVLRFDRAGTLIRATLAGGSRLASGEFVLENPANEPFVSIEP